MDRANFFSYIKKSIVDTVKEVGAPFIEEDLKKVDQMVDNLAGVKWLEVPGVPLTSKVGYQDLYVHQHHLGSYFDGVDVHVYDKICPKCQTIAHYLSYDKKLKCFSCDTFFTVIDHQGDLKLKEYETKCENGVWFIGIL